MTFSAILTAILVEGAKLLATSAAGEFAKGAGKSVWEGLKARLAPNAPSLAQLDQAADNPAYRTAIESDLAQLGIAEDPEVQRLALALQQALAALPPQELAAAAIDVDEIRARGSQLFEDIEGIRARQIVAETGDQTFRGIKAPKPQAR